MKTKLAALAIALLAFAGCTTVNTVQNAEPVGHKKPVADKRVITDDSLNRAVSVVGLNTAMGNGGFLQVQVEVQNTTRLQQAFTYRVEWYDEYSMLINLPTYTAIPVTLQGMEDTKLSITSPTPRAKDFRIKFLEPMN